MPFSTQDAQWLSDSVRVLYEAETPEDFVSAGLSSLDQAFHLTTVACEAIGPALSSYALLGLRTALPPPPDYVEFIHDNPLRPVLESSTARPVQALRDHATLRGWARTDHYHGIGRPMGLRDQLLVTANREPASLCFGLFRDRIFTAREKSLAGLLQPHLAAACRRVGTTGHGGTVAKMHRLSLNAALKPTTVPLTVRECLTRHFSHRAANDGLPAALKEWVRRSLRGLSEESPPRTLHPLRVQSAQGELVCRCYPAPQGTFTLVLHEYSLKSEASSPAWTRLTAREREVLHWIGQGKRDAEIARILDRATGTVSKHVEHILAKLGVGTRAAAVRVAGDPASSY